MTALVLVLLVFISPFVESGGPVVHPGKETRKDTIINHNLNNDYNSNINNLVPQSNVCRK